MERWNNWGWSKEEGIIIKNGINMIAVSLKVALNEFEEIRLIFLDQFNRDQELTLGIVDVIDTLRNHNPSNNPI